MRQYGGQFCKPIDIDARTNRMVWSFNGQGMLGMKGETVLLQCH